MDKTDPARGVQLLYHPAVERLSYLLGRWRGEGEGGFPTISSFKYIEEVVFSHSPSKPIISYSQKTWKIKSGTETEEPMHSETGFFRPKPDGTIEVVIAQSTGIVEVQKGTYDADERVIKLKSTLVGNAAKVIGITREFKIVVNDDGEQVLTYEVQMTTHLTPLQSHLKASLKKL